MRPVADLERWTDALSYSHRPAFLATVIGEGIEIPVESGSVVLDHQGEIRGRCDVTLTDDGTLGLRPDEAADLLAPYGNQIQIERGVVYPDGIEERVSLGVFRIDDSDVSGSAGDLEIQIAAQDRAAIIVDAEFEEPGQIPAGTNVIDALELVLAGVVFVPELETSYEPTDLVTPTVLVFEAGGDRWAFMKGLADAIGAELYFDGDGVLVLRPIVDRPSVMTLATGSGGVVVSSERRWTRGDAVNRVVVVGENSSGGAPVRGIALDDDPTSPTYYYGTFGKKTEEYSNTFVVTQEQCDTVAQAKLTQVLGTTRQATFSAVPNPALEAGDTITLTAPDVGVYGEDLVLDALTIPIELGGTMSAETRTVRVA